MNSNLIPDERKEWARTLYVDNGKSQKEVAQTVNVEPALLRHWIKDGLWDSIRRALLISKKAQLEKLYAAVEALNEKMKEEDSVNPKDVDLLLKYTNAIKNLDTSNSAYSLMETGELFINWLHRRDLELTKVFTDQFELFIRQQMALE